MPRIDRGIKFGSRELAIACMVIFLKDATLLHTWTAAQSLSQSRVHCGTGFGGQEREILDLARFAERNDLLQNTEVIGDVVPAEVPEEAQSVEFVSPQTLFEFGERA